MTEYTIPFNSIQEDVALDYALSLQDLREKEADEIRDWLRERIESEVPAFQQLGSLLLESEITSLIAESPFAWLHLHHTEKDCEFYYPLFVDSHAVEVAADQFGFSGCIRSALTAFIQRYGGLREIGPTDSGFIVGAEWQPIQDFFPWLPEAILDEFGEWRQALPLFISLYGDVLVLDSRGRTAWAVFDSCQMVPFSDSLEEAVKTYADFKKEKGSVFSAYDACDFIGRSIS